MPCTSPIVGSRSADGKIKPIPNLSYDSYERAVQGQSFLSVVSCGQCMSCRLQRSIQWALRCSHEAMFHSKNSFITVTYSPECLPPDGSLILEDHQLFMKRFRKKYGKNIRFYMCGEYGDQSLRPHYHYCMFGFDDPNKRYWKRSNLGHNYYISDDISDVWGKGYVVISDFTFETAAYVARYCTKKVNGKMKESHYAITDPLTGEVVGSRKPEFNLMSRRPGVGLEFYEKYKDEIFPDDFITMNGKKYSVPKYYDNRYQIDDEESYNQLKELRKQKALDNAFDNTIARLNVKRKIQDIKASKLIRKEI